MDYQALFDHSPNAYMVLDRELRYVAANATYLRLTASRLEDLLGQHLFARFPNDPDDPNNVPAKMLRGSLERVLTTRQPDTLALIPYRVPKQVDGRIVEMNRYWSATHTPILDGAGEVQFILQNTSDVTDLQAPAHDDAIGSRRGLTREQLTAAVLSRAEAVQAERHRMEQLFQQAPGFMCILEGPEHLITLANRAYHEISGDRELVGKNARQAFPELIGQGFFELLDGVYRTGIPYFGNGVRILLQRRAGSPPDEVIVDFVYQPIRDAAGAVSGIFVQGHDITARFVAERERAQAQQAAEAFSSELVEQSDQVRKALEQAYGRIRELEAEIAKRG